MLGPRALQKVAQLIIRLVRFGLQLFEESLQLAHRTVVLASVAVYYIGQVALILLIVTLLWLAVPTVVVAALSQHLVGHISTNILCVGIVPTLVLIVRGKRIIDGAWRVG